MRIIYIVASNQWTGAGLLPSLQSERILARQAANESEFAPISKVLRSVDRDFDSERTERSANPQAVFLPSRSGELCRKLRTSVGDVSTCNMYGTAGLCGRHSCLSHKARKRALSAVKGSTNK